MSDITLRQRAVLDSNMAYREAGDPGRPFALFLHGNPTSSYIWRNIIPLVAPVPHCIAPDLIGFGQSGKPDIEYRFADHVRYLDAFIKAYGLTSAYLVAQDWGTGLAFHLAARRPDFVRGLAFMEFIRPFATWDDFLQNKPARGIFRQFRTPGVGEEMILENNLFVEAGLAVEWQHVGLFEHRHRNDHWVDCRHRSDWRRQRRQRHRESGHNPGATVEYG